MHVLLIPAVGSLPRQQPVRGRAATTDPLHGIAEIYPTGLRAVGTAAATLERT